MEEERKKKGERSHVGANFQSSSGGKREKRGKGGVSTKPPAAQGKKGEGKRKKKKGEDVLPPPIPVQEEGGGERKKGKETRHGQRYRDVRLEEKKKRGGRREGFACAVSLYYKGKGKEKGRKEPASSSRGKKGEEGGRPTSLISFSEGRKRERGKTCSFFGKGKKKRREGGQAAMERVGGPPRNKPPPFIFKEERDWH